MASPEIILLIVTMFISLTTIALICYGIWQIHALKKVADPLHPIRLARMARNLRSATSASRPSTALSNNEQTLAGRAAEPTPARPSRPRSWSWPGRAIRYSDIPSSPESWQPQNGRPDAYLQVV
ncbi:hypothetical protein E8E14_005284 [Neopestalotiopsis sp. 37M]|nr:hypothetical protein E8E14_005284 [Neopestalotiopsis sp. 37M]